MRNITTDLLGLAMKDFWARLQSKGEPFESVCTKRCSHSTSLTGFFIQDRQPMRWPGPGGLVRGGGIANFGVSD